MSVFRVLGVVVVFEDTMMRKIGVVFIFVEFFFLRGRCRCGKLGKAEKWYFNYFVEEKRGKFIG